jgi:hypothetical protein
MERQMKMKIVTTKGMVTKLFCSHAVLVKRKKELSLEN